MAWKYMAMFSVGSTLLDVTWQKEKRFEMNLNLKLTYLVEYVLAVANSLTLHQAHFNIMLALMQYHSVQRGILTQAKREIDFPHGLWEALAPDTQLQRCLQPQQQAVIWKTHHDDSSING